VYHSIYQISKQWQSQQYNQSLTVTSTEAVNHSEENHLQAAKCLASKVEDGSYAFIWFDASEQDINLYKLEFPDSRTHLNPLYLAMHQAYSAVSQSKQIMINLRQATEHTVTHDRRLIQPEERSSLSISSLIKDLCVHIGLSRNSWEKVYHKWRSAEYSDDAYLIDAYLNGDRRDLDITSETLKEFDIEISLKNIVEQIKELWVVRLKQIYTESCGLLFLTNCLISQVLQSFKTEHKIYPYPDVKLYVDEQVRCAPHRGDRRIMSGQNSCDLSLFTLRPLSSTSSELAQEQLQILHFGGAETEVELCLLDATPLQLHVQFGLNEQHKLILDPSQMDSICFDTPISLTTLFDESFIVLLRQDSSVVTTKVLL